MENKYSCNNILMPSDDTANYLNAVSVGSLLGVFLCFTVYRENKAVSTIETHLKGFLMHPGRTFSRS